jgi:heme-degrading monooxygenase HmoA
MFVVVLTLRSNFRQYDFMKARAITVDGRRDSHLEKAPGFVAFYLLKGPEAADHTLYASHTVGENRAVFEACIKSETGRGIRTVFKIEQRR